MLYSLLHYTSYVILFWIETLTCLYLNIHKITYRSTSHIQSTCHDFCCKKRKTIKSIATHKKDNHTICDRTENILSKMWIVSIVRRQTEDVVCTGSALSSRVILTTADCVEKWVPYWYVLFLNVMLIMCFISRLSTTDLVVKNSNKEELTIAKTLRDDRYHLVSIQFLSSLSQFN